MENGETSSSNDGEISREIIIIVGICLLFIICIVCICMASGVACKFMDHKKKTIKKWKYETKKMINYNY